MAIYMKYSSPDISGGVTTGGFAGQIELFSYQFGISRAVSSPAGGGTNRNSTTPSVSEITVTKVEDEASGNLYKEALSSTGNSTVIISMVRTDGTTGGKCYLEYTLSNVMISSYAISGGGDRPQEALSLNFTKIESKFIPEAVGGDEGDPFPVTYDLTTQQTT